MDDLMMDYELTLQHVLWRMEKLNQQKPVVTKLSSGLHRTTYGEMLPRINQLAAALDRLGVRPGDRVATLAWNNFRHLELYCAVPCMGAVLHTLNIRLFHEDLAYIIEDAQDRVIFVDRTLLPVLDKLAGRLPSVAHLVLMDAKGGPMPEHALGELLEYESLIRNETTEFGWPALRERMAAAMCYTSGTTGHPKGVVYSHRSQFLHTMGVLQVDSLGLSERDAVFPIVPMFHANSWGLPYACAMAGCKLIFPDRWMGDASAVVELAETEEATVMAGVPTIWVGVSQVLEQTGKRLAKVRTVACGGAAIPRGLMERMDKLGLPMLHAWGMTETSPVGTAAWPRSTTPPDGELEARLTQGYPVPGVELRLADPATGEELAWDGEAFGEIQVRGPWIARGYHHDPDPARVTEDGWFKTGDVAKIRPDGAVVIVDRTKDLIKSGGEWISSVDLENAIMGNPKVLEASVIGVPHPRWGERPVAYVVARPEHADDLSAEEIRAFLDDKVATWWQPDEVRFIAEIPKTSVGKFDKKVLRAQAVSLAVEV